jgi:hypothetical protein
VLPSARWPKLSEDVRGRKDRMVWLEILEFNAMSEKLDESIDEPLKARWI